MKKEWILAAQPEPSLVESIAAKNDLHAAIARVLGSRGFDPETAEVHLNPSLGNLHDPYCMKNMDKAVKRVTDAVRSNEKIAIHGDYDVDGIAGVALLYTFLKRHDCAVSYYIPHRIEEGYGLSRQGVELAAADGVSLIVTVDTGTTDHSEIEFANQNGIDVIVTDHHEPGARVPDAHTILNPKCEGNGYPFPDLSGCGVAFKLSQALSSALGDGPESSLEDIDLVALATVCDVVPMVGENRILARFGLELLSDSVRPGIAALKRVSGLKEKDLNVYHIGFALGPRLNAAGRLASAEDGLRLLITDDASEAEELAAQLDRQNRERQELNDTILLGARQMIEEEDLSSAAGIVLASRDWHEGVIGIVASRIAEKYHRPTVIISTDGQRGKGSARSVSGFNLYAGLEKCRDLLESFGGHELAAGLVIDEEKIPLFRSRFEACVKDEISVEELIPKLHIDTVLRIVEIDPHLFSSQERMRPFGMSNPGPVFLSRELEIVGEPRIVGKSHLKFKVRDGGAVREAIAFHMGGMLRRVATRPRIDLVYAVRENEFRGKRKLVLHVRDLRLSGASATGSR